MLRYVVISPVRNEASFLQKTIDSIVSQTIKPQRWIIVNDGSSDSTGSIAEAAAKQNPWITVVHRLDRGFRKSGGGVIEAFYDGYTLLRPSVPLSTINSKLSTNSWSFLAKLDGDLSFEPDYFQRCFAHFDADPKLGIGGGTICGELGGQLIEESPNDPPFHVRGATKIYRRKCWEEIGGLIKAPGWDTLDEIKANMLGWKTSTFRALKLHQHRNTGVADGSWKNWVKNGLANYIAGYQPIFMFLKCAKRGLRSGSITIPAGLGWGFLSGYLKRVPRVEPDVMRYVRREQLKRICFKQSLWG